MRVSTRNDCTTFVDLFAACLPPFARLHVVIVILVYVINS